MPLSSPNNISNSPSKSVSVTMGADRISSFAIKGNPLISLPSLSNTCKWPDFVVTIISNESSLLILANATPVYIFSSNKIGKLLLMGEPS